MLVAARADLAEAVTHYAEDDQSVASRLVTEYESLEIDIAAAPGLGSPCGIRKARFRIFPTFPYSVYYIELTDKIAVMAVAHHRRRTGYWRRRPIP